MGSGKSAGVCTDTLPIKNVLDATTSLYLIKGKVQPDWWGSRQTG
jgi:hypothetical protein